MRVMGKKTNPTPEAVITIDMFGPPPEPVDPHAGKKSEVMEPVVRAATGEKKVSIFDIFGH
jgi:hypothetical protein